MATKKKMKTVKTSEATNIQLDWLVAKALDEYEWNLETTQFKEMREQSPDAYFNYTTDWAQMGPIIEREKMGIMYVEADDPFPIEDGPWCAYVIGLSYGLTGPTLLIAAARCYVTSKLGETVEVPEELE